MGEAEGTVEEGVAVVRAGRGGRGDGGGGRGEGGAGGGGRGGGGVAPRKLITWSTRADKAAIAERNSSALTQVL